MHVRTSVTNGGDAASKKHPTIPLGQAPQRRRGHSSRDYPVRHPQQHRYLGGEYVVTAALWARAVRALQAAHNWVCDLERPWRFNAVLALIVLIFLVMGAALIMANHSIRHK